MECLVPGGRGNACLEYKEFVAPAVTSKAR